MKHHSEGATALLGMPGLVVGAEREMDGEIWLHVEPPPCAGCSRVKPGRSAKVGGGLSPRSHGGHCPVWAQRLWRCPEMRTWSGAL